jgi:hypothetical protein
VVSAPERSPPAAGPLAASPRAKPQAKVPPGMANAMPPARAVALKATLHHASRLKA